MTVDFANFSVWVKAFLKGPLMFPKELQPLLDAAEASLAGSNEANEALDTATAELQTAQANADAAAQAAQAAHLQSVEDATALIDGLKKHFNLS